MNFSQSNVIERILALPLDLLRFQASGLIKEAFQGKFVLETESCAFDIMHFSQAGKCALWLVDEANHEVTAEWDFDEERILWADQNALFTVAWGGKQLHVVSIRFSEFDRKSFLIGPDQETIEAFFAAVCRFSAESYGELIVYDGGFSRSPKLKKEIETNSLEKLVLSATSRETLRTDIQSFFESESLYRELSIAWRRGVLLTGPPGNGKTAVVKAIINLIQRPTIVVRELAGYRTTVRQGIERVYAMARRMAPSIVVLEDIDSLIDSRSLSYFLNELDGFASNHGVLTLATTNHPEKLDSALLKRPSRFDRKIYFGDPQKPERIAMLKLLLNPIPVERNLSAGELEVVAKRTKGYSFAYLKECVTLSLLNQVAHPEEPLSTAFERAAESLSAAVSA